MQNNTIPTKYFYTNHVHLKRTIGIDMKITSI